MRWLSLLALLLPSLVAAQPGATAPTTPPVTGGARGTDWLARGAHDAAVRGDCATAQNLATRIAKIDPAYHAAVIATDSVITSCVYVPPPPPPSVTSATPLGATNEPVYRMEKRSGSPEISGGRLAGELFLGGLLSLGGGLGGFYIGYLVSSDGGCCEDGFGGALVGGTLGLVLGASAGVALAGQDDDENYSFGATVGGGAVGGIVGIALAAGGSSEDFILPMIAAPTIGAMIGFNLSRSYKSRPVPMRATYPVTQRELVPPAPRLGGERANVVSLGSFAF